MVSEEIIDSTDLERCPFCKSTDVEPCTNNTVSELQIYGHCVDCDSSWDWQVKVTNAVVSTDNYKYLTAEEKAELREQYE